MALSFRVIRQFVRQQFAECLQEACDFSDPSQSWEEADMLLDVMDPEEIRSIRDKLMSGDEDAVYILEYDWDYGDVLLVGPND